MYKDYVVYDLDGTLVNIDHRLPAPGPNTFDDEWVAWFKRCVDDSMNGLMHKKFKEDVANPDRGVLVVTARPTTCKAETVGNIRVLTRAVEGDDYLLYMRNPGDFRDGAEYKLEWLLRLDPQIRKRIVMAYDDDEEIIEVWNMMGIPCELVTCSHGVRDKS